MAEDKKVVEPTVEEKVDVVEATEPEQAEEPAEELAEVEKVEEKEEPKKVAKPKAKKAPKEEVKVEPVAAPKKIGGRVIVSTTFEGDYCIVVDEDSTTYKLPKSEFNAL